MAQELPFWFVYDGPNNGHRGRESHHFLVRQNDFNALTLTQTHTEVLPLPPRPILTGSVEFYHLPENQRTAARKLEELFRLAYVRPLYRIYNDAGTSFKYRLNPEIPTNQLLTFETANFLSFKQMMLLENVTLTMGTGYASQDTEMV